jgi:ADYC domain-containing protein
MNRTFWRRARGRWGNRGGRTAWALRSVAVAAVCASGACTASFRAGSGRGSGGGNGGPGRPSSGQGQPGQGQPGQGQPGQGQPGQRSLLPTNCSGDDCTITTAALRSGCPTGSCDPGPANGNGIYVVTGGNYCLAAEGPAPRFCPQTFLNHPGGVRLSLLDAVDPRIAYEVPVRAVLAPPSGPQRPVELVSIRGDRTRLTVRFKDPDRPDRVRIATDEQIAAMELNFVIQTKEIVRVGEYRYALRVRPLGASGEPAGLRRYDISYRLAGAPAWAHHCAAGGRPRQASFLGGKRVDGVNAAVTNDDGATTLSCETGAIETCLQWGYTPWNPKARTPGSGDYLFGSCLQAKRAAYFVGRGDLKSYTQSGTEIVLRDPFGIQAYDTLPPEAIWSPRGAECLNSDRLRRAELRGTLAVPPDMPRCDPLAWSRYGKLATGPGTP